MSFSLTSSCSGKVLLTGGYLIMNQSHSGLVFSLPVRFHTSITFPLISSGVRSILSSSSLSSKYQELSYLLNFNESDIPIQWKNIISQLNSSKLYIRVLSPDYNSVLFYVFGKKELCEGSFSIYQLPDPKTEEIKTNTYVSTTLFFSLNYLVALFSSSNFWKIFSDIGFDIVLHPDPEFYSLNADNLKNNHLRGKTGLGSSASLVASLTSSLVIFFSTQYFNFISTTPTETKSEILQEFMNLCKFLEIKKKSLKPNQTQQQQQQKQQTRIVLRVLHNLSQMSHCYAQNKVGSGFDISSAIYSSHLYTKFNSHYLDPILSCSSLSELKVETIKTVIEKEWDSKQIPFPPHFLSPSYIQNQKYSKNLYCVLLGDVQKEGSSTPLMVKQVHSWNRESTEISKMLWGKLGSLNENIHQLIFSIFENISNYEELSSIISEFSSSEIKNQNEKGFEIKVKLNEIKKKYIECINVLSEISIESKVEILPERSKKVINKTMDLPFVLMSGVPGAGGDDSIYAIVVNKKDCINSVINLWKSYDVIERIYDLYSKDSSSFFKNNVNTNNDDNNIELINEFAGIILRVIEEK